jgi:heparanase
VKQGKAWISNTHLSLIKPGTPKPFQEVTVYRISFLCFLFVCPMLLAQSQPPTISPANMSRIGTVDERFQSYNVEMVEVTGGRFWKPYSSLSGSSSVQPKSQPGSTPAGMDPNLYQYRAPIDLSNPRLRKLAAALGPAYVRVSGTWANSVYFQNSDDFVHSAPPAGFGSVLTRKEWRGVIDFARAVNAEIVTSFATSQGTRDDRGVWTPEQARQVLGFTKSAGGRIAAAEFMNEPTFAAMGGAPEGYDAIAYARDMKVFLPFIKQSAPEMKLMGPGSVGEGSLAPPNSSIIKTQDLLKDTGPVFGLFSYHVYAAVSRRCANLGAAMQTSAEAALSKEWLSRSQQISAFYSQLRDQFEPGKPLWITETADAACGGNPWASTFLDTFRYLVQHASLAQQAVKVIMHNTLASSDYGLLDENTLKPRPNYWAAVLWRKLLGATVLDPHTSPAPNVYVYAHCQQNHPGGVSLLVINADRQHAFDLMLPLASQRYILTASKLETTTIQLNGKTLALSRDGELPQITGEAIPAGRTSFGPISITFLAIPTAYNASCR